MNIRELWNTTLDLYSNSTITINPSNFLTPALIYGGVVKMFADVAFDPKLAGLDPRMRTRIVSFFMIWGAVPITFCITSMIHCSPIDSVQFHFPSQNVSDDVQLA